MDYFTSLREAHAKQQREREEVACEMGQLIVELCGVLSKIETVLSSPQIAILIARQEALIMDEEERDTAEAAEVPGTRRPPPTAPVYPVPDMDSPPDPTRDEFDGPDV